MIRQEVITLARAIAVLPLWIFKITLQPWSAVIVWRFFFFFYFFNIWFNITSNYVFFHLWKHIMYMNTLNISYNVNVSILLTHKIDSSGRLFWEAFLIVKSSRYFALKHNRLLTAIRITLKICLPSVKEIERSLMYDESPRSTGIEGALVSLAVGWQFVVRLASVPRAYRSSPRSSATKSVRSSMVGATYFSNTYRYKISPLLHRGARCTHRAGNEVNTGEDKQVRRFWTIGAVRFELFADKLRRWIFFHRDNRKIISKTYDYRAFLIGDQENQEEKNFDICKVIREDWRIDQKCWHRRKWKISVAKFKSEIESGVSKSRIISGSRMSRIT